MSIASSQRSRFAAARLAERPAAPPESPSESPQDREWDGQVAREVRHQEVVEATFDRAEAYARLGDFERAVEWLDRAATAGGDLSAHVSRAARTLDPGRPIPMTRSGLSGFMFRATTARRMSRRFSARTQRSPRRSASSLGWPERTR